VYRFRSDYDCKRFTTYAHLQTMVYAHLTEIRSLRTLEVAINSQKIGIKNKIKKSTLSDANNRRSAEGFFWILQQLMSFLPRKRYKEIQKVVRILDSSPIQLRGKNYDNWSKEFATRHIQGLKLHIEYDLELNSPLRTKISHPNCNDSTMGKQWPIQRGTIYVFDKGYYDYNWWWNIHQSKAFFVTRLKKNAAIVVESQKNISNETILEEGFFKISKRVPRGGKRMEYSETLRYVHVKREGKKPLVLVTNLKDLSPENVAALYKARWEIELFFKWIKQNLKLKKFLGRSANAVKIQIATALISYLLVQLFKNNSSDIRTLQLVLTWIRFNLHITKQKIIRCNSPPIYQFPQQPFLNRRPV